MTGRYAATRLGAVPSGCPPIFVSRRVIDQVLDVSDKNQDVEVGGFLLGGFHHDDQRDLDFIEITEYVAATQVTSGYRSLTFTHESWSDLHRQIAERYPGHQVMGWHHTHPGFGIFLSRQDEFIHRNFFDQPWHVAMVVDPRRGELGFFQWQQDQIVDAGFLINNEPRKRKS